MEYKTILAKLITLIYRESHLETEAKSNDLIKNVLSLIKVELDKTIQVTGTNKTKELKDFCYELLNINEPIEKDILLQKLRILLENDDKYYKAIEQAILPDYEIGVTKRVIISLIKYLTNYYKEYQVSEAIHKASYDLKFNRNSINNFNTYIGELISKIEPLQTVIGNKDPAIMNELDLTDETELLKTLDEIKNNASGNVCFKLGWQRLNNMTQGGFRRGEFVVIEALQHKYKTGFTLSLFAQILRHNTPVLINQNKKPLIVRISFEDKLADNLQFLYQYLRLHDNDGFTSDELKSVNPEEMSSYIKKKLTINGFHIKLLRVDPTLWSYKDICNKIIEFEAQGYEVQLLMLDYLALVPTTYCLQGPMGTDRRDQFRRIRNFCQSRKITVITPHQLSTEAKQLIRNGVSEVNFVKEIKEKGYSEGSKQLDQEIDLELYIHLFNYDKTTYLSIQRGKHRIPTIIDENDKFFLLKFPSKNSPILEDINTQDSGLSSLPKKMNPIEAELTF